MKQIRQVICLLLALCLLPLLQAPALAAESAQPDAAELDALYKDKSWDQVIGSFLEKYGTNPANIAMGYYNTVTGEEHYFNGDQYMVAGSMYKVPLNMAFAEKVAQGEMDWDSKIGEFRLGVLRDETIIYSNNDLARTLWTKLSNNNGYHRYREIIAPYMGEDAETVDQKYYENNFFTSRQMIFCLKLLYDNPERFPTIVETMQKAEPSKYFKLRERRFDIAHKYGYLQTDYHLYLNDCGIAFTDDPILLVIFTDEVGPQVYAMITEYCTLMCDYTQYHTAERLAIEKAEAERLAREEAEAAQATAEPTPKPGIASLFNPPEPTPEAETASVPVPLTLPPFLAAILVLVGALAVLALLLRWRRRYGLQLSGAVLSAALTALALLLCTLAASRGALLVHPGGSPQQTVTAFFEALDAGDYERAYACLDSCSSLGLETEPESAAGRRLYAALRESYAYSLVGEGSVDGLNARQQLQLRYLDIPSLEDATRAELPEIVGGLARGRELSEVFDENNNYRPAFAQDAYAAALDRVLQRAEDYYATDSLQLTLSCESGSWRIVPDRRLLRALAGGLNY